MACKDKFCSSIEFSVFNDSPSSCAAQLLSPKKSIDVKALSDDTSSYTEEEEPTGFWLPADINPPSPTCYTCLSKCCINSWPVTDAPPIAAQDGSEMFKERKIATRNLLLQEARRKTLDGRSHEAILNYLRYLDTNVVSTVTPHLWQSKPQDEYSSSILSSLWRYISCWRALESQPNVWVIAARYDLTKATKEDATVWDHVGLLFFETGKYREAEVCYTMSLRIDRTSAEVFYHKGILLRTVGKALDALDALETATRCGTNPETQRPFIPALFSLGTLRLELNRLEEAKRDFETILKYDPTHTAVLILISDCLEKQYRFDAAIKTLQKAQALDPNDYAIRRAMERVSSRVLESTNMRHPIANDNLFSCIHHDTPELLNNFNEDDRLTTQCPSDLDGFAWGNISLLTKRTI